MLNKPHKKRQYTLPINSIGMIALAGIPAYGYALSQIATLAVHHVKLNLDLFLVLPPQG